MHLKIGIVGLPNAGKSTLFNALLKKQVAFAANYPFATIEPNIGIVPVPDERLTKLAQLVQEEEHLSKLPPLVPATVGFVDIAGLVAGASKGEGLGNKFLSHIREVDLICHVVRFFPDPGVVHVAGELNPQRDQEIIETELILTDLQTLDKQVAPKANQPKEAQEKWRIITKLKQELNQGKLARNILNPEEAKLITDLQLLTVKPVLYVGNSSEEQIKLNSSDSSWNSDFIHISAKVEEDLAVFTEAERAAYLKDLGVTSSGLDRLIQKAYRKLGLISFLTAGEIEVRAWTIKDGTLAPQAAGVIHTDFEKKFIKAEIITYADLILAGSRGKARENGKLRLEGKEYKMRDADVVEFKIGS